VLRHVGSNVSTEQNASKFREERSSYDTENTVFFPDRDKRHIFLQTVTTGSEAHPTPLYNGHRGSFTGGKSAGA
jgi:hypothetical protein